MTATSQNDEWERTLAQKREILQRKAAEAAKLTGFEMPHPKVENIDPAQFSDKRTRKAIEAYLAAWADAHAFQTHSYPYE